MIEGKQKRCFSRGILRAPFRLALLLYPIITTETATPPSWLVPQKKVASTGIRISMIANVYRLETLKEVPFGSDLFFNHFSKGNDLFFRGFPNELHVPR